jgi:cation transport regulator
MELFIMPTGSERTQANPQIDAEDKQLEMVNKQGDQIDQAELAQPQTDADKIAAKRQDTDVDEQGSDQLPSEVTDKLLDGADQVFMAAFKNAQDDGLSREGALQVAWNSVKQGFARGEDGSWHRKSGPDDRVLGSGVGGSAS